MILLRLIPKREINLERLIVSEPVMEVCRIGDICMIAIQVTRKCIERKNCSVSALGVVGYAEGTNDTVVPRRPLEWQTALRKEELLQASFAFHLLAHRVDAIPIFLAAVRAFQDKPETQDVRFDKSVEARTSPERGVCAPMHKVLPPFHFNGTIREFLDRTILVFRGAFRHFVEKLEGVLVRNERYSPEPVNGRKDLVCDSSGIRRLCFNTLAFQPLSLIIASRPLNRRRYSLWLLYSCRRTKPSRETSVACPMRIRREIWPVKDAGSVRKQRCHLSHRV